MGKEDKGFVEGVRFRWLKNLALYFDLIWLASGRSLFLDNLYNFLCVSLFCAVYRRSDENPANAMRVI
jgi:hypothetical protein